MPRTIDRPTLRTPRLLMRPLELSDAPRVRELAGDPRVAATTAAVPHPYPEGAAETWIATHEAAWRDKAHATFAVCTEGDGLVGCLDVLPDFEHARAGLGYWIGHPYWGRGLCTEAASVAIDYAFDLLNVDRVYAFHMLTNPASGRVMAKAGMSKEGVLRRHFTKNGKPHDVVYYGILREELDLQQS